MRALRAAVVLAAVLVVAGVFVGLLVWDRVVFLVVVGVVGTNLATWRITGAAARAEQDETRALREAIPIAARGVVPRETGRRARGVREPVVLWPNIEGETTP